MVATSSSTTAARALTAFVLALGLWACRPSLLSAQAAPACLADNGQRTRLKNMLAVWTMAPPSDSVEARRRTSLHLPVVTSTSQIVPITSNTTCGSLRTALAQSLDPVVADTLLSVVAVQIDTIYVAFDTAQRAGEFHVYGVYGSANQELKTFIR